MIMRQFILNDWRRRETRPWHPRFILNDWCQHPEKVEDYIRADETNWMPLTDAVTGATWITLVNDEDFCRTKKDKMRLRKQNRHKKLKARTL